MVVPGSSGRRRADGLAHRVMGAVGAVLVVMVSGCQTTTVVPVRLRVESEPAGALATLVPVGVSGAGRTVVGITPVEAMVGLGTTGRGVVSVEKRGFEAAEVEVMAEGSPEVRVQLERIDDAGQETALAHDAVPGVMLLGPDVELVVRRFASEEVSADGSASVQQALAEAIEARLAAAGPVSRVKGEGPEGLDLEALRRDLEAAVVLVDPVRLPFLARAPRLQSAAGRRVARELGASAGKGTVLLVAGRGNVESAGMKVGKAGIMAAGTASSYASGMSRAMASGDELFTYNVYVPVSSEGTALQAVLIACETGEVLWVNRGLYPPGALEHGGVDRMVADLLTGADAALGVETAAARATNDSEEE